MPRRRRIAAAITLTLLLAVDAGAAGSPKTRYSIRTWPENRVSSVTAITQTHDGYLWLGTLYGLVRFDGFNFTTFDENNTPGLENNRIFHLFEDSRSNLWVGTESAGIKIMNATGIGTVNTGRYRTGTLKSACEDNSGGVWLYTTDGYVLHHTNGHADVGHDRRYNTNVDFPSNCRMTIAEKSGQLWLGNERGLFTSGSLPPEKLTGPPPFQAPRVTNVNYLLANSKGGFWCLAAGRIQRWSTNGMEPDSRAYPWNPSFGITAACEDKEGNLVVGTYGDGVYWFESDGTFSRISREQGLSANNVLSMTIDRDGALWVGTDGSGLNRVRKSSFNVFSETEGRTVQSISQDENGGVWVGLNGGPAAVQFWKNGDSQKSANNPELLVKSVLADGSNTWVGTWGPWIGSWGSEGSIGVIPAGLFRFSNGTGHPEIFSEIKRAPVSALFRDSKGTLWVGAQTGLWRVNGSQLEQPVTNNFNFGDVRALAEDKEGNLWIGTDAGGLICHREGKLRTLHRQDGLPSEHVSSLYVDADGVLWIGTSGGLARYHQGKFTRYGVREGLASNSIGYLLEDAEGFLWIGSNAGLMRIEKNALNNFAKGMVASVTCRVYQDSDGLPTGECTFGSQPAACRLRDGTLLFPTIKGLASLDPKALRPNTNPPPVVIDTVVIEGEPRTNMGIRSIAPAKVTVPANREHLEIQFTSLNLAAADKTRFMYRMENHESAWTPIGRSEAGLVPTARYPKLPPGDYVFRVKACNEDGVWNETGASVAITVLPPFWRTWWFMAVVTLVLLALIVSVVRYVSTQHLQRQLEGLRQQQALERERARIARDIHDQLGASLTQVSLLGEMVESDKNSPAEVEAHAKQISRTARDTSHVLDEIVWTVNPSNDTLDGLVNYVCKYAQEYLGVAGLRYRLEAPAELPDAVISPEVRHNVFLAAKEAVTNVVRHAQATTVWVRLRTESDSFTLEIQDDGRGIPDLEAKRQSSRNGLRNMGKRMEDIGGKFDIVPAPEHGTIVRMTVPIKRSA